MSPTHGIDIHRKFKAVAPTRQRNANSSVRVPQSLALQTSCFVYMKELSILCKTLHKPPQKNDTPPQTIDTRTRPPCGQQPLSCTSCSNATTEKLVPPHSLSLQKWFKYG